MPRHPGCPAALNSTPPEHPNARAHLQPVRQQQAGRNPFRQAAGQVHLWQGYRGDGGTVAQPAADAAVQGGMGREVQRYHTLALGRF